MEKISAHISYKEATRSNTALRRGIENTPDNNQYLIKTDHSLSLKPLQLFLHNQYDAHTLRKSFPLRHFLIHLFDSLLVQ